MKQKIKRKKTDSSGNITISILREELKNFATKDDLKSFATKKDLVSLKTDMSSLKTDMSNFKIDVLAEINRAELKAIDREQAYHSNVMTEFDKIMKKLEEMNQGNAIDNFQRDKKIEDHEERIKVLESSQKS